MAERGTSMMYFHSLNRPFLMVGIDRLLFFPILGLSLLIAYSHFFGLVMDLVALGVFGFLYTVSLYICRIDPYILAIYKRHIRYASYYRAQPVIGTRAIRVCDSVPIYQGKRGII